MTFETLVVVGAAGLLGPTLAVPRRWNIPVVIGELLAGIALGRTGARYLDSADETFTLLADAGFALVMFVVGTHVPVRDPAIRPALRTGAMRAVLVGAVAVALGAVLSAGFGTGHWPAYAVLMASSSAALVLPMSQSLKLGGPQVLQMLPQVAVADAICIVALPLAIDPQHAARAAAGGAAVLTATGAIFFVLRELERRGLRRRLHRLSEQRKFAFELRINLIILFALVALALRTHVSIMLAGFAFGLGLAMVGEPRRLARQLFAVTEGFFGPVFFVWLGASLDLRDLGSHRSFILLGALLGLGAIGTHLVTRLTGQPVALAVLAAAQLGVPVAAVAIGSRVGVLQPGEASAMLLGAIVTIAASTLAAAYAARHGMTEPEEPVASPGPTPAAGATG